MSQNPHHQLSRMTTRLLRPLVRLLLRQGFSYGMFVEAAKHAFVEVAEQNFALPDKKQTVSRISTITGLSRKEVFRIQNEHPTESSPRLNRAARVMNGWMTDARYHNAKGTPRDLPFEGPSPSFTQLVKEYSGDITARTIADELTRIGAVILTDNSELHLQKQAYIPASNSTERFDMLATDVAELIDTIAHNIEQPAASQRRLQRKVYYDNIPFEYIAEIKKQIEQTGQNCLQEINRFLVNHDRDQNPDIKGTKRFKLGLAMHVIEEEIS